ncbi:histone-lysine n-methyltransferase [Striga asiatica]|uniref:Histone-lysine n-methyltransferase n=1 Tax=Striga asiatica TaxID=4170 RepID=A0A5A7QCR9_STRAF|nr:histone-lysine n-methyltransferase [Striga asiatica]
MGLGFDLRSLRLRKRVGVSDHGITFPLASLGALQIWTLQQITAMSLTYIDCIQTMKGLDGRESRLADMSLPSHFLKFNEEASENVPFCIDAGKTGNFARFINHSCQPNLFVQCMLSSHHDLKQARIMLIAAHNIPPLKVPFSSSFTCLCDY